MKDRFRILGKYIRQHRNGAILLFVCAVVLHIVLYLYKINPEIILYADAICLLILLVSAGVGFAGYYRRWKTIHMIDSRETVAERIPAPETAIEEEYSRIISMIQEQYGTDMQSWNQERKNSLEFYATWVHQIKVPIATMKLVLQSEDTEENRELLAELFRIEQYVNMVLNYYRLEGTETDFVFRDMDLDDGVRQVIHKYAGQFIRKKIRLDFQETGQTILTDEKWFLFLLEQIISNAVKYTNAGTITIRGEGEGVLNVTDTGIGIAPEDIPRIFEKGFTGYNGRMDKKATGLGLYLCKKTADKLSIRLQVTSEVGVGTTVRIYAGKESLLTD